MKDYTMMNYFENRQHLAKGNLEIGYLRVFTARCYASAVCAYATLT